MKVQKIYFKSNVNDDVNYDLKFEQFKRAIQDLIDLEVSLEIKLGQLEKFCGSGSMDRVADKSYQVLSAAAEVIGSEFNVRTDDILDYVLEDHGALKRG